MADETIRDLERQAAQGDQAALARLLVERARAGDLGGVVLLGHCHSCVWWSCDTRQSWDWGFCGVAETRAVTRTRQRPPGSDPMFVEQIDHVPVVGEGAMACAEPRPGCEGDSATLLTRGNFGCVQWTKGEPGAFTEWLLAQAERTGVVGEAARWAASLPEWPKDEDTDLYDLLCAINERHRDALHDRALNQAWDEWLVSAFKARRHPLPRVPNPRESSREE